MEDPPAITPFRANRRVELAALPDPLLYVGNADLALSRGNRRDAEFAITMAYLAFDLIDTDFERISSAGTVRPGRNS